MGVDHFGPKFTGVPLGADPRGYVLGPLVATVPAICQRSTELDYNMSY